MTDPADDRFDAMRAIEAERLALCDFLDTLGDDDWSTQSWCDAWTVRQVVAHLTTSTRTGWSDIIVGAIAARGNFDRMERDRARRLAGEYGPADLVEQIRATASSPKRAPMSGQLDPLVDFIVHGQDIARPIGARLETSPSRVAAALNHVVTSRWYGAQKRFADLSLKATDCEWSFGQRGDQVGGTVIDLLLVATGRAQVLPDLTGDGVVRLAERLGRGTSAG